MFTGEDQAIAVLDETTLAYHRRESAVHYLAEHPTQTGIKRLVRALSDHEFAVRWAASVALSQLGPPALPEVLRALADPELNTARMREGAIHILHYSSDLASILIHKHQHMEPKVYLKPGVLVSVGELMAALKGPAADVSSMHAAGKLLLQLENLSAGHFPKPPR
ncbi:MAG: HEAT repeat domain-containing protein [Anaerolineales bacterium]